MKARKDGEHPFGDIGQLILLVLFLLIWVGDSFFLRKSIFLADYVPLYARLFFLAVALLAGLYLLKSGHVVLDHGQPPKGPVTTGAFRHVRHPLYLGCMLVYIGLTISTVSLLSLALFVVISAFYDHIARYEERWLEEYFGDEYREYKKRTGKWVPRLGRGV